MTEAPEHPRQGCVLILIYPVDDRAFTVFIKRNEYDGIHSGQISFPGGQVEQQDGSHHETALREAWEETGIDPRKVSIIGELTRLYIPPSNFLVFPVLGYSYDRPSFRPDPSEVQQIIELEVSKLSDPAIITQMKITLPEGVSLEAPCYALNGHIIWGATAMMVSELLEML